MNSLPLLAAAWMARLLLVLALFTSCKGAGARPDLERLLEILERDGGRPFGAEAIDRGCPADQSIGEYVGLLVEYGRHGDAPGDAHSLEGGCGTFPSAPVSLDPPVDSAYWYCTIEARTGDRAGESPWHYELRIRVRKADAAPDLETLACPGGA